MKKTMLILLCILCSGMTLFGGNDGGDTQSLIDEALKKNPRSPLVAVKGEVFLDDIGSPVLQVLFYNRSEKEIDAFEFDCVVCDTFGRMVSLRGGRFRGLAQHILIAPNQGNVLEWNLFLERNASKAKAFRITLIHFTDDTVWRMPGVK